MLALQALRIQVQAPLFSRPRSCLCRTAPLQSFRRSLATNPNNNKRSQMHGGGQALCALTIKVNKGPHISIHIYKGVPPRCILQHLFISLLLSYSCGACSTESFIRHSHAWPRTDGKVTPKWAPRLSCGTLQIMDRLDVGMLSVHRDGVTLYVMICMAYGCEQHFMG